MAQRGPRGVLYALGRLERWSGGDQIIESVQRAVRALPLGPARDILHGRPGLGHPLHPALVQVPVGTWLSATVLDFLPGVRRGPRTLIGVGLVFAIPAAASGWTDWAELHRQQQRVGLVHALANSVAVGVFTGSFVARSRGSHTLGKRLGLLGFVLTGVGGALGGHMAYRQASGTNHAEYVPHAVTPGWHPLGAVSDLPLGRAVRREVDGVPVMVVREGESTVRVLAERCSHMGGPLSEGEIADGCVRCPWHGSVFRLSDGWNVKGPATAPQPAFESRIVGGRVEARIRQYAERRTAGASAA
ncbi:Rieske 2Fe-2S domain-containing protein [Streptomyces sp. TP-A0874]|uniref:Rieske 2Fe-2S domain-containing protein n=1 Tax=Streptomyces sp. TP-A0874 TaxID=549819 RepID=UPI0008535510|nr:Rieske 2Fe-2S domain-containing protein [Streptomyces sp. TP-A0874]